MITIEQIKTGEVLAIAHCIRKEVFVIEQNCPEEIEWEFEEESTHYIAKVNNVPVGTARWRSTKNGIKLERFAVVKNFRKQNVGEALLLKIIEDTNQFEKKRYLHAQLSAKFFYLKYGLMPIGECFWEGGIEHVKMEL